MFIGRTPVGDRNFYASNQEERSREAINEMDSVETEAREMEQERDATGDGGDDQGGSAGVR